MDNAYLTARLAAAGLTEMPQTTPAGEVDLETGLVRLAGQALKLDEVNGLAALLAGRPAAETDGPLIAQLLERLPADRELRVLCGRSTEQLGDLYEAEAMGVALHHAGQWHLGALISEASGSCGWYEALSLGGTSLLEVTLYPEYGWPETLAATRLNAEHPLAEALFAQKWTAACAERTRLQAQRRFASEGAFVPVPGGRGTSRWDGRQTARRWRCGWCW